MNPVVLTTGIEERTARKDLRRRLIAELKVARRQERLLMAYSGDWSKLGSYLRASLSLRWYRVALELAEVVLACKIRSGEALFERTVGAIVNRG